MRNTLICNALRIHRSTQISCPSQRVILCNYVTNANVGEGVSEILTRPLHPKHGYQFKYQIYNYYCIKVYHVVHQDKNLQSTFKCP